MTPTLFIYTSPYRPLDLDAAKTPVDWANTDRQWNPRSRYAFTQPLPERFVSQWDLVLVPENR